MLSEFSLIDRFFARRAAARPSDAAGGTLGIGDDCALLAPRAGELLAISTDMLVEGRHFFADVDPEALGHKALAVNLSDLAAMGARPQAFTLAFSLPKADEAWLAAFSEGLFALAGRYDCELIGGDTTGGPLNLCITVFGSVPPQAALRRDAARPGDDIWISGTLGDARAGLGIQRGEWSASASDAATFRRALERPEPRVALGMALRGVATAAIDLSDGLVGDLGHVMRASRLGATLRLADLPHGPHVAACTEAQRRQCLLAGGDDYELLFAAPATARAQVRDAGARAQVAVTCIGTLDARHGLRVVDTGGAPVALTERAFDHFTAA